MRNNYLYLFYFILYFLRICYTSEAQNTVIKHYGVSQGLPSSECYWVMQDSKGYLWIATDAGVVKYDGYRFRTYSTAEGLPDNTIFKIHEDKYGRIWFSSYSGSFSYYSSSSDSIYSIKANAKLAAIIKTLPIDFCFDDRDTLYISIDKMGYLKIFPPFYDVVKQYQYPINCVFVKKIDNEKFIYSKNFPDGSPKTNTIPFIYDDINDLNLKKIDTNTRIKSIGGAISLTFNKNKLVATVGTEILELNNNHHFVFMNLPSRNSDFSSGIISAYIDNNSRLWINKYNKGTSFYKLNTINDPTSFLKDKSVSSVFQDNSHGLWFTTLEDGLFFIPTLEFKYFNKENGLTADKVLAIAKVKNDLICLMSDHSFNTLDLKKYIIHSFKGEVGAPFWNIKSFADKYLICGSPSLIYNSLNSKSFPIYFKNKLGNQFLRLKDAEEFDSESILGCEYGSLYIINKKTGLAKELARNLPTIFSICKIGTRIYLGTKTGLYKYSDRGIEYLGDKFPLLKSRVDDILFTSNKLFLATKGNGIIIFDESNSVISYSERDGLASNIAKFLTTDYNNNVWVGTNRGISRLKKASDNRYNVNTINLAEGLISNEINQLVINDSILFFATNKGLGKINIKYAFNEDIIIPTYIEDLTVNNVKYKHDSLIQLNYNQNFIQVVYKGINVKCEGNILYKYRLEGLDSSWTYTHNTFVQYTTLPPGNYKFVVFALNANEQITTSPAIITFTISSPFWKTWWFNLGIVIVVFIITYLVYLQRIKSIKKQEKEKAEIIKRISESELKALRAQMNPHFMFNAINSIQNFVLKNDSKSAQKYLTKFARLIRSVLENSKHELVWLNKEVEALELYVELEALRSSFSFDYEIIMEDSLSAENLFIPPMIIQPYIENAILHGIIPLRHKRGLLKINFSKEGTVLKCVIDDNGIGRKKAKEIKERKMLSHQSMGMNVTQDRIDILNAQNNNLLTKVVIIDKEQDDFPAGTTVEITINIKNSQND